MKAYLVTLGCPKNLVDSEATVTLLRHSGVGVADDPADADVLLVNACSFLESSWQETVEEVERLAGYRRGDESKRLVLMGCLPKHRNLDLAATLPDVDHFLPTGAHGRLPELVKEWRTAPGPRVLAEAVAQERFQGFGGRDLLTPGHTAYVKVAEGCNRKCTFCAIPSIRGRQLSRPAAEIVAEIEGLAERGVREVTLLAQDIVSYSDEGRKFPDLLDGIVATGVEWIRIFYLHPAGITPEYVERLLAHPSVCAYLEMPVQHASSRLLSAMNRSHDRGHIERLITGIRAVRPDAVIRSEVIVGFPGETDDEFEELVDFVEQFQFDSLGIFPYSPEPGTPSAVMDGMLDPALIRARVERLTSVQEAIAFGARARFEGKRLRVLVDREIDTDEGLFEGCRYAGRFYGQALEIDGEVYIEGDGPRVGEFVEVLVDESATYDLRGVVT